MEKKTKGSIVNVFGSKMRMNPPGTIRTGNGIYFKDSKEFIYIRNGG